MSTVLSWGIATTVKVNMNCLDCSTAKGLELCTCEKKCGTQCHQHHSISLKIEQGFESLYHCDLPIEV